MESHLPQGNTRKRLISFLSKQMGHSPRTERDGAMGESGEAMWTGKADARGTRFFNIGTSRAITCINWKPSGSDSDALFTHHVPE
jgi:hypothetical protein